MLRANQTTSVSCRADPDTPFIDATGLSKKRKAQAAKSQKSTTNATHNCTSKSNKCTPQRCGPSHPSNPSYYGFSSPQVTSARKEEMIIQVKSRVLKNVECVVEQAQPRDAPTKRLAEVIIRSISESIEELVVAAGNSDAPDAACHETSALDADGLPSDRDMIGTTLPWIRLTASSSTTKA
ncbi:hypothetical protein COEREDRAFT_8997 [Coemansia reversa NRRL 1564]|uniref:Uncharacterized protein n=1 Tax=Coemansia reversa (strain ATCC 12441 / NRRL 1564) TaxID=763665 RepID=A0A2G5B9R6_COERN|nr:hypothetical protein COEREDRAFT_8997 [Coemansia reversa NRRL 1564]|eukprot:PIA15754.1 hypothetical protein COEREDRAFT_8997 [Coemansia reversa NRRL 1564]